MSSRGIGRARGSPRRRWIAAAGAGVIGMALVVGAMAQSASGWDLSFRATSGGGGPSSGGSYAVLGSIGQPVTGVSADAGNVYTVASGYLAGGAEKYVRFVPLLSADGTP